MVNPEAKKMGISQSSILTGIDLDVKVSYNRNSSLSVGFIDMATVARRAEKARKYGICSLS